MRQLCDDKCYYKRVKDLSQEQDTLTEDNLVILHKQTRGTPTFKEGNNLQQETYWQDNSTKEKFNNLDNFTEINDHISTKIDEYESSVD